MKLIGSSLITLGLLLSFVFAIILAVMVFAGGLKIGVAIGLTILINVLLWLFGPWVTDFINRFFYGVTFYSQAEVAQKYPHLAELIGGVSTQYKFKFPKFGLIADNNPTAFTYGSARYNARLIMTEGMFKYLNEKEQKAVVAHELGHIVHRDFVVMMIGSTLVQILYELYAVLIRMKGRKSPFPAIGLVSYVFYLIGTYLLLFLSRTRETLADNFAAERADPEDLSSALAKIAYGILTETDDPKTARLLASTRHMGLVDVKGTKNASSVAYMAHDSPEAVAEAMLFDIHNPWARWSELNSTHPLTGRRIQNLSRLALQQGKTFSYDVAAAAQRVGLDASLLWRNFLRDVGIVILPYALFLTLWLYGSLPVALVGMCVGFIVVNFYRYPRGNAEPSTVTVEIRNPYASPVRGKPIQLEGQVVGRGVPGYVFSEDMMYQDKSGLLLMNYHSAFGFIGNFFFALKKIKTLIGLPSRVTGWYYRGMAPIMTLRGMEANGQSIRSYAHIWDMLRPIVTLIAIAGIIAILNSGASPG